MEVKNRINEIDKGYQMNTRKCCGWTLIEGQGATEFPISFPLKQ